MARRVVEEKLAPASFGFRFVRVYEVLDPNFRESPYIGGLIKFSLACIIAVALNSFVYMIIKKDVATTAIESNVLFIAVFGAFVPMFMSNYSSDIAEDLDEIEEIYHPENIHVKFMGKEIREKTHERDQLMVKLGIYWVFASFLISNILGPLLLYFLIGIPYPLQYPLIPFVFLEAVDIDSWIVNYIPLAFGHLCALLAFMFVYIMCLLLLSNCICQLEVLIEVTKRSDSIIEIDSFEDWIKIVMELMVKSRKLLLLSKQNLKIFLYYWEKLSYMTLLVSIVVIQLAPDNMGILIPCAGMFFYLFLIASANETIKERFKNLNTALYDIPWYELKPKQRRDLMMLIQWSQEETLISSGGMADITYEWYLDLVKKAYSGGLILKDLVM